MDDQFQQTQVLSEEQLFQTLTETTTTEQQGIEENRHDEGQQQAGPVLRAEQFTSQTKDEKKEEKKKHKGFKDKNSFVKASELNTPRLQKILQSTDTIDGEKITQEQLLDQVRQGDYSHMQRLDPMLRNRAATEYLIAHPIQGTADEFVRSLKQQQDPMSAMMNPLLRIGISQVMNAKNVHPDVIEKYKRIDDLLNKEIMIATITKRKCSVQGDDFSEEDKKRNVRSQVFIMKTLLSSHIGRLQLKKKDGNPPSKNWPYSVANAFAHCSRVVITLPGDGGEWNEKTEDYMLRRYYGNAGFYKRSAATHNMELKRKNSTKGAKEQKSFTPFNQYGMNVAVGGLGNNGIPKGDIARKLKNDGSCGHVFMHFEKGDKQKHSGMLIGFESDSVGKMNQTGHVHDASAKGEFASSFGGQRGDEIGDKYGGREVDLSNVNADAYAELMTTFDLIMTNYLESEANDAQATLNYIAEQLCGNLMNDDQLKGFIKRVYELGNAQEKGVELYNRLYVHN